MPNVLAYDIGGTKTSWAVISDEGELQQEGRFPTPQSRDALLEKLYKVAEDKKVSGVGIAVAGVISPDHKDVVVCPHIPELSHFELVSTLESRLDLPVSMDNDGRCALVGEVWQGAARETSSAVMLTLGTGIGGGVMQKGNVLAHPNDITKELSHLVADPSDLLVTPSGRGTVESLLGGKYIEERFGIPMEELVEGVKKDDEEAITVFQNISYYFIQVMRAVYDVYHCKMIIIGGHGAKELELYLRDKPPCPVLPATLGESSGLYGAARLALDKYEADLEEDAEWGEEA